MAIDISNFAKVSISVSPAGVSSGNFGILGFLTNEEGKISTAERSRSYKGLKAVLADWPATTEVGKAAKAFFAIKPTPTDFVVHMCFETAQAAVLTGGGHKALEELIAIDAGNLKITTDKGTATIDDLDFTTVSSSSGLAGIATALATAINTKVSNSVTVTHTGHGFQIKSATVGTASTITFAEGDAAEALGLEQHQGKLNAGIAAETPVTALGIITTNGTAYTGLVTHKKYRDVITGAAGTTTLEIGQFASANKKIFCNTTNSLAALSSVITTDTGSKMKAASLDVLTTFSKNKSQYPSAAVFGRAASVNFSGVNTTITLNLKQLAGITAEDLTTSEFATLKAKRISVVAQIGNSVSAYTDSRLASGIWFDSAHGLLWAENRIETDMFNLLYQSATSVPYTQAGLNSAEAKLEESLQAAVRNGLVAPGYLPDGTYLPTGYQITAIPLAKVPSSDKGARTYAGLTFVMIGAGALHEIAIYGSFVQ